jgi:hypothetical protein
MIQMKNYSFLLCLCCVIISFQYISSQATELIAGNGGSGFNADGLAATSTSFNSLYGVWGDTAGNIYLADQSNNRIRKMDTNGIVTTVAGMAGGSFITGGPGTATAVHLGYPWGLYGYQNSIYFSDQYFVWKLDLSSGTVSVIAGNGGFSYGGDNGPATSGLLNNPTGIAVSNTGIVYISDYSNHRIRKIENNIITTFAGTGTNGYYGDGGAAVNCYLYTPYGVWVNTNGVVFIADSENNRVRYVTTEGYIYTFAGGGDGGDGGLASSATLSIPSDVKGDSFGNVFILEYSGNKIRMVDTNNIISTFRSTPSYSYGLWVDSAGGVYFTQYTYLYKASGTLEPSTQPTLEPTFVGTGLIAGNGNSGFNGDGLPAISTSFYNLYGVWGDDEGNIYLSDQINNRIRKMDSDGIVTTVAGFGGASSAGGSGDATALQIGYPWGIVGYENLIYFSDEYFLWELDLSTGTMFSVSGSGVLSVPTGVAVSRSGIVYVADFSHRIQQFSGGNMTIFAGTGTGSYCGDDGPATEACLYYPYGLWVNTTGVVFIADSGNNRVRYVTTEGYIYTFAGGGSGGDGGLANEASLSSPYDVKGDLFGNVFIAEAGYSRVRVVDTKNIISTLCSTLSESYGIWIDANNGVYFTRNYFLYKVGASSAPTVEPTPSPTLANTVLVAGNGGSGFNGDGYPATSTSFYYLYGVWGDDDGNVYLADHDNSRIRKMNSDGIVTTVAGSNSLSSAGGSGAATSIPIGYPWGIVGYEDVIYFSDEYFVWELDLSSGIMSNITDSDVLNNPTGVAVSGSGIIYVADYSHRIFQITDGSVTVFAGTRAADYCGDGGPATEACLCDPYGLWVNTDGMLFIADYSNNRVRCVTNEGFIYTFAGGGGGGGGGEYVASYSFGDGGLASEATLSRPSDVKGDSFGNIFIVEYNNYQIRIVDTSNIISTICSTPSSSYGIWIDANDEVYFTQPWYLYKAGGTMSPTYVPTPSPTHSLSVIAAGNGNSGFNRDGLAATSTSFDNLYGVWGDTIGNIYLSDQNNYRIRKIDPNGIVASIAGSGDFSDSGGSGSATSIPIGYPWGIAGYENLLYFSDEYFVWELDLSSGTMSNLVDSEVLNNPTGVAVSSTGIVYVADYSHRIHQIADGSVAVFAGTETADYCGDDGPATDACLYDPYGLWVNTDGVLFIADYSNNRVRYVTTDGFIYTFAGGGRGGGGGITPDAFADGGHSGLASEASLSQPYDVKGDLFGNVFIAEVGNYRIRMVDTNNIISTYCSTDYEPYGIWIDARDEVYFTQYFYLYKAGGTMAPTYEPTPSPTHSLSVVAAGNGGSGFYGDGFPATSTSFNYLSGIWGDTVGNIYLSDQYNSRIRKIDPNGIVTTVAGSGSYSTAGDSGPATSVDLAYPWGISGYENLIYFADQYFVWELDLSSRMLSTIAGNGESSFDGDNGPATAAALSNPTGVTVSSTGTIFIADYSNHRIRKIEIRIISTFAGSGSPDYCGDGGPATDACLYYPIGLWVDSNGVLFIADYDNNRVRQVTAEGYIYTFAGSGNGGVGEITSSEAFGGGGDGLASEASLCQPYDVKGDLFGNVFIAEVGNNRIRMVDTNNIITTFCSTPSESYGIWIDAVGAIYFTQNYGTDRFGALRSSWETLQPFSSPKLLGIAGLSALILIPRASAVDEFISLPSNLTSDQPTAQIPAQNRTDLFLGNKEDLGYKPENLLQIASPQERGSERLRRLQNVIGSEFQINTNTADNQYPAVAALAGGGFLVTWQGGVVPRKIYGQLYSSTSSAIGSEFQINTNTADNSDPGVAALAGGGFVVTWHGGGSPAKIYGKLYSSMGSPIGSEFQLNTNTASISDPAVAALAGGGFVVTWHGGSPTKIYGQLYSSTASAIGTEFQINTNTANNYDSSVTVLVGGGFVVTWHGGPPYKIYGQLYSSTGSPIGSEFQINTNTVNNYSPAVAALVGGGFVVTWYGGSPFKIYGQLYSSTGSPIGSEFQINTNIASDSYPAVAALEGGSFVVTWQSGIGPYNIKGQLYSATGSPICSEFQINTNTASNYEPDVAALVGGGFVVTWHGGASPIKIYGQLLSEAAPTSQPSRSPSAQPSSMPTRRADAFLSTGLIAEYPFNGNAHDMSGNGNNGVVHSATLAADRFGNPNSAYRFNGNSSYIEIPNGGPFNFVKDFSISTWVNPASSQVDLTALIDKSHGSTPLRGWTVQQNNAEINNLAFRYYVVSGAAGYQPCLSQLVANAWNHLAIIKKDVTTRCYLNNIVTGMGNASAATIASNGNLPLTLGAWNQGQTQPASGLVRFFTGLLDDIRIYNRTLSSSEVSQLYSLESPTSQPSGQPSGQPTTQPSSQPTRQPTSFISGTLNQGLVAYYPFDGNARDQSGNGNNGEVHSATLTADRFGNPHSAYSFNSINSYIEVSKGALFNFANDLSLSLWLKPGSFQPTYAALLYHSPTSGLGWSIEQNINELNKFYFGYGGNAYCSSQLISNTWNHLVITKKDLVTRCYVNSILTNTQNSTTLPVTSGGNAPFVIGAFPSGDNRSRFFNGTLDDIFIFNRTLTAQEVLKLSQFDAPTSQPTLQPSRQPSSQPSRQPSGQPSSQPSSQPTSSFISGSLNQGLVAYYPFDGNARDQSGNGNNGVVHSATLTSDRLGHSHSAYNFNGISSYIEVVNGAPFDFANNMSLAFWVNLAASQPSDATLFSKSDHSNSGWFIKQNAGWTNQYYFVYRQSPADSWAGSDGHSWNLENPNFLNANQWYHLAVTKMNTKTSTYLNGNLFNSYYGRDPLIKPNGNLPLTMGVKNQAGGLGQFFNGILDDIFIYNRTLAAHEVLQLSQFGVPTSQPTGHPSSNPTDQPSQRPSDQPTEQPSSQPTRQPTRQPTKQPINNPSGQPTSQPTSQPSGQPSSNPTDQPTDQPTGEPSNQPTSQPTLQPFSRPTGQPTRQPSIFPSSWPTLIPTLQPISTPSAQPSGQPSSQPASQPTGQPSLAPSVQPSSQPTGQPNGQPSLQPNSKPTTQPTGLPTRQPLAWPTGQPTRRPSVLPSSWPTLIPTLQPTLTPSTQPSTQPTSGPSGQPNGQPTGQPSLAPSVQPTAQPSGQPASNPTGQPAAQPSTQPSSNPTGQPTDQPSLQPIGQPTGKSSTQPTGQPTWQPFARPTGQPTRVPSIFPSSWPTLIPTLQPISTPSAQPSGQPSSQPASQPTGQPSLAPRVQPSSQPISQPSTQPSSNPTGQPTDQPTGQPSSQPNSKPTGQPSLIPTSQPSSHPLSGQTTQPTSQPSFSPSIQPTSLPSSQPTGQPSVFPSSRPTFKLSTQPTSQPSSQPTTQPSSQPTSQPTTQPSVQPTQQPIQRPSSQPTRQPTAQPSGQPTAQPIQKPSSFPTNRPTSSPTSKQQPGLAGWLALLGPESPIKHLVSLNKLLAATQENKIFHFNASSGALLGKYTLPWDVTKAVLSNSEPYNNINFLGSWNHSSSIASCFLGNNKMDCSYVSQPGMNYENVKFHSYSHLPLALGRDGLNRTITTFFSPAATSITPFSFSLPSIQSLSVMSSSDSIATSFVAGLGTSLDLGERAIAAGLFSLTPSPNIAQMMLLAPLQNQSIHNKKNLINAATLLPGALDPMIGGGIDLGSGIKPYLVRLSSLASLNKIVCAKQFQESGSLHDLFFADNHLYAMWNSLSKKGNSLQSSLKIVGINPENCEPLSPPIQITGPGNITCSHVTPTSNGFSIACHQDGTQALIFTTDKNLTFNNLPSGYRSRFQNNVVTHPLNLSLTSLLSTPLKGKYVAPVLTQGSCSLAAEPFTQILPENMARYVPLPSRAPTMAPTFSPTSTRVPSFVPSQLPTYSPTFIPSLSPSSKPTISSYPTSNPSSSQPTGTHRPTPLLSLFPSLQPSISPTNPPSLSPTRLPTKAPITFSSFLPTFLPTKAPLFSPTKLLTLSPTNSRSRSPSFSPTPNLRPKRTLNPNLETVFPTSFPTGSSSSSSEGKKEYILPSSAALIGSAAGACALAAAVAIKTCLDAHREAEGLNDPYSVEPKRTDLQKESNVSHDSLGSSDSSNESSWDLSLSSNHDSISSTPLPSAFGDLESDSGNSRAHLIHSESLSSWERKSLRSYSENLPNWRSSSHGADNFSFHSWQAIDWRKVESPFHHKANLDDPFSVEKSRNDEESSQEEWDHFSIDNADY